MPRLAWCVVFTLTCALLESSPYAAPQSADADAKELASYRLTLANLTKVRNLTRTVAQQMLQDPKFKELSKLKAEIKALEAKPELSDAEQTRLDALVEKQDALEESIENPLSGDAQNLSEMEARIKKYPPLMQALQKEGMAPREYATFWLAFVQAAFAHGFQKSGMLKELPAGVNPDNVKFMAEHTAELEAMQKEFEAFDKQ
jgi:septal ring factor EnvC (AmiA/AmiB activator)